MPRPCNGSGQRDTESELQLDQLTLDELEEAKKLDTDVVIYPAAALGMLAERKLIAAPSPSALQDPGYNRQDIFDLQRTAEVRWGDQTMAFSFGSPQLVLAYRADLFAALKLEPPQTWADYERLVERLQRDQLGEHAPAADAPWTPACEPLAAGWAGQILLARSAAYAAHPSQFSVLFDYSTMRPLVAGPPFVRALTELVASAPDGAQEALAMTPDLARQQLFQGHAAMAICWPHPTGKGDESTLAEGISIAFAPLPGATQAYNYAEQEWTDRDPDRTLCVPLTSVAGKLGSVTPGARRPREAAEILALLTGTEWSETLSPVSPDTTLFRFSHLSTPAIWTDNVLPLSASENYAEVVRTTQSMPVHVSSLRISGYRQYMAVLDQCVQSAATGERTPTEALTAAATRLGRDHRPARPGSARRRLCSQPRPGTVADAQWHDSPSRDKRVRSVLVGTSRARVLRQEEAHSKPHPVPLCSTRQSCSHQSRDQQRRVAKQAHAQCKHAAPDQYRSHSVGRQRLIDEICDRERHRDDHRYAGERHDIGQAPAEEVPPQIEHQKRRGNRAEDHQHRRRDATHNNAFQ